MCETAANWLDHRLPDGRVRLDLGFEGRFVDMTPQQFLAKLAALVPPPRPTSSTTQACSQTDITRGHASCPCPMLPSSLPRSSRVFDFTGKPLLPSSELEVELDAPRMPQRSWAHLLARVFAIDVTT